MNNIHCVISLVNEKKRKKKLKIKKKVLEFNFYCKNLILKLKIKQFAYINDLYRHSDIIPNT